MSGSTGASPRVRWCSFRSTRKGPLWSDLGIYTRAGRLLPTATDNFVQDLKAEIRRREQAEKESHG